VRKQLEERGLVKAEEPRIGRANVLLYSLAEKGYQFIGLDPPKLTGGGSPTHQHISHWIADCGRKDGHAASCEWKATGTNHAVDCAVQVSKDQWHVFEVVVTCADNLVDHLTTLSTSPAVRNITVVCLQKQIVKDLQEKLATEPIVRQLGERLRWDLAETFLRRLYP
jgi:hypothetical protein